MPVFHLNIDTVVAAGQTINAVATGGFGYEVDQGPVGPNFTNFGNITFTLDPSLGGVSAFGVAPFTSITWDGRTLDNEGSITVTSTQNAAFLSGQTIPAVINGGTITVTGTFADGINTFDPTASFTNSGHLIVSSDSIARGVFFSAGGTVVNSGVISAVGTSSNAGIVNAIVTNTQIDIENDGQITASAPANTPASPVALHLESDALVVNHGLISAPTAITTHGEFDDGPGLHLENSGSVIGDIDLRFGQDLIVNSGTMTGAISLGEGDDTYDGRMGTEIGLLQGGLGNDTLMGGAGFDNLQGNQGNDSVSGGAGDDFVVGGKDDDIQSGGDGNDVVWGNLGNDTLDGGNGADQVRGGQGDDSLSGGAGDDFISGDRGNDTESGGAGADIFHGSQDAGIDRVLDFHLAEGDRVMLDPGTTFTVTQVGADTVVDMGPSSNGAANQMILVGVQMSTLTPGWIFGA